LEQPLGIQMLSGLVDQFKQDLPLAGESYAFLSQRTLDGVDGHNRLLTF
jgi:hypothetical protein